MRMVPLVRPRLSVAVMVVVPAAEVVVVVVVVVGMVTGKIARPRRAGRNAWW